MERPDLREGFALILHRRLEEARVFFQDFLRIDPNDIEARFGLGCVYAAMGERDRAVEEWRHCLELNPHMGEAHYALAWAHYDAEDYQKGYQHVEAAHRSGVALEPLRELFQRFVKTGKPLVEGREEEPRPEKGLPFLPDFFNNPWVVHLGIFLILSIACYLLLRGTLYEGYPHDHLDATVAFYIAKLRILLTNGFRLYTPVWYLGYELLRFYPPLSTLIPYVAVRLTGNLLTTYYSLCLIYYTLYVLGTYLFAARFLNSKTIGFLAALLWLVTHVNVVSFQGHYWETARLMGTALVPWALYFVEGALSGGRRRDIVVSILVSSYVLLSSMLSAMDLLLLLLPFLFVRGGLAPTDPEPQRYSTPERMGRLLLWGLQGVLGLTVWWYIPAILPHGLGAFLSVGKGRPPPLFNVLFRLHPPSWMTAIQLPITLLGLVGVLLTLLLHDRRGAIFTVWFLATTAVAYIIGLQSVRLILDMGFSLVLLSAFAIQTLEEQLKLSRRDVERWLSLPLILLVGVSLLYAYLPIYSSYATVDDAYRSTDEYLTATWLADHLNGSYRVYVMYGDNYRGTQWLNAFEPEVRQVLGGFDQGGRAMSLEPFKFDYMIKWSINSTETYKRAVEHHVKYIVIDRRWMLRNSPDAYEKFSDARFFKAIESINDELRYAEIYEVVDVAALEDEAPHYVYWNVWRVLGVLLSMVFIALFTHSLIRSERVIKRERRREIEPHTIELRVIKLRAIGSEELLDLSMYLLALGLILVVMLHTKAPLGFPKGTDARAHIYKIEYVIKFFPYFFWNYQWDVGTPLFGGTYPPMSYYMGALIAYLTKLPIETALNLLSAASTIINMLFILAFLYTITNNRIISLIGISLLIFTPPYWGYWVGGGTYGRVISMLFIGPSLYIASQIYINKRNNKILLILLPIMISLGITTHLIGGGIALILVIAFILFNNRSLIHGFINSLKILLIVISLVAFYVAQYRFSNPAAKSLIKGITYYPAKIEYLIKPTSSFSLNTLTLPILIISIILYIFLKWENENVKIFRRGWFLSSLIYVLILMTYGYIGYLPNYPNSLYIDGFPPEHVFGISSIGYTIIISLLLSSINRKMSMRFNIRIIRIIFLIVVIICGFIFELPIIRKDTVCWKWMRPMDFVEVEESSLQHRLGSDVGEISLWFNYLYDVPQTGGYYAQGVPYQDWCSWRNNAIWKFRGNQEETEFLLDWYAIRWVVLLNRDPTKFLDRPDLYRLVNQREIKEKNRIERWYEFEYLNASVLLSSTNAPPVLFIGSPHHYDVFLRALSLSGLRSDACIPVRGPSRYVDSYKLEELSLFPAIILYGYDYKNLERMSELLSTYVSEGGCLFLEANGSPDYAADRLPDPFPVRETHTYTVVEEWAFNISTHPIVEGINFTYFAPAIYGELGWGISTSSDVSPWAETILASDGRPLIVAGEYQGGRVVWSGMNLFYHTKGYGNLEEARFIARILEWLDGAERKPSPSYNIKFMNPQKRVIELEEEARGILFKENYFPQWHATLIEDGGRRRLRTYLAGPGLTYIPLPSDVDAPSRVILRYGLSPPERIGYVLSVVSLCIFLIVTWKKPRWIYSDVEEVLIDRSF